MDLNPAALLLSLAFNIALPAVWLTTLSRMVEWHPLLELCIGLAFPLTYGLAQAYFKRTFNPISALSLASILLTAAVGFFAATRFWFAVKGAAVPLIVSLGIRLQRRRVVELLEVFLAKGTILNKEAMAPTLGDPGKRAQLQAILHGTAAWLSWHFLFNAALNSLWNWVLVTAAPGTTAFNEQYGALLARNLYLVALPCAVSILAIVGLTARRVRLLTGLTWSVLLSEKPGVSAAS